MKRFCLIFSINRERRCLKLSYEIQGGEWMLKLVVIADDFTGALDTGVQFSKQGIKTIVTTDINIKYSQLAESVEVLVIDTESRFLSSEAAYQRVKATIESAQRAAVPYLYKKVDSALRGNVSSEIKALLDAQLTEVMPFLPAYPEINRQVINGNLYINHVLVAQSIFAADPYEPVTESNIIKRLKLEADIDGQLVQGNQLPVRTAEIFVFDTQTDAELKQQLTLLKEANLLTVSVGCAGFAKQLAQELFPDKKVPTYSLERPLVVISGSLNPITKGQIEYAVKRKAARISLTPQQLLTPDYWESSAGKKELEGYVSLLTQQPVTIFETLSDATVNGIKAYGAAKGQSVSDCRFQIGHSLGELTKRLWQKQVQSTFLFTGGDTLFQSMNVLGIKEIVPIAEISLGVVLSTIEWQQQKLQVITKSGGFGEETLLEELSNQTMKEESKCL